MFDSSTLYTNIPQQELKSVMGELINFQFFFIFSGEDKKIAEITRYGAIWNNNHQKYGLTLKLAINY